MSSDEDDYVCYGNALDPIDEDSIPRKKPITAEDQYAKDERGRRRFHGAFTGGFSAGFFNSVGSVEGWQPTHFVSSRTNRTQSKDQTIFDFMDDEDTGEYGICPMSLQVKSTFDTKASIDSEANQNKRRRISTNKQNHVLDTSFVRDVLAPTRDTVGVKLLVKMGWRPGQGVGPRITKREKRLGKLRPHSESSRKVYSCRLPTDAATNTNATDYDFSSSSSETELDYDLENITFAPNDYQTYIASPKQNTFGLGYKGIDRKPVLSSKRAELSVLTLAGKSIRGQAFGVSVFEEDDDDVYCVEDMADYDFSLPYAGEPKIMQQKTTLSKNTNCIEGFYVSMTTASKIKSTFVLPSIPIDFQPLQTKKKRWDCPTATSKVQKTRISSATERSIVLQIDDIDDKNNSDRSSNHRISEIPLPIEKCFTPSRKDEMLSVDTPEVASAARVKFFAYDMQKQNRYEKYLTLKNPSQFPGTEDMSSMYPSNMTEWEKEREKYEFEQATRLYRPLDEDLASRFTRGTREENVHDVLTPVEKSYDAETEALRKAVTSKMYGALTRKKFSWKPDKIVCKRFNVPEPLEETSCNVSVSETKRGSRSGSLFEFLKMSTSNVHVDRVAITSSSSQSQSSTVQSGYDVGEQHSLRTMETRTVEEDSENDDQIDKITDKIDLFKAIFLACSEDEDENEIEKDQLDKRNSETALNSKAALSALDERNVDVEASHSILTPPILRSSDRKEIRYSPARGIFANLDLESLKYEPSIPKDNPVATATLIKSSSEANVDDAVLYGPKIPKSLLPTVKTMYTNSSEKALRFHCAESSAPKVSSQKSPDSSSPIWVEKSIKHKSKKHKTHKKQKRSKHRKRR